MCMAAIWRVRLPAPPRRAHPASAADRDVSGFCVLFKMEARIGGTVICPNPARLLGVR